LPRRRRRVPQALGESPPGRDLVFALDAAATGQQQWRALARQAARPADLFSDVLA
jgi:hypothetical protein